MTTKLMKPVKVQISTEGHRQTVVLPDSVHLADEDVYVVQIGTTVMLYTKPKNWEDWWNSFGMVTDDFMADRDQPTEHQIRESLDD